MRAKSQRTFLINAVCLTIAGLTLVQCGGGSHREGKPLAKVGNSVITEGDLEVATLVNPRLKARIATPAGKQKTVEQYAEQELVYLESMKKGLDKKADVQGKIEFYKKLIIAEALLEEEAKKKSKEYYDNHKDEFERVKISHIFIRVGGEEKKEEVSSTSAVKLSGKDAKGTKKEAPTNPSATASAAKEEPKVANHTNEEALKLINELRQRLIAGGDFADVAKSASEDLMSKANGGDLGMITIHDKRLEKLNWLPIAEKSFSMKAGEVSEPIKTADGYHIIKVTEEKRLVPYEEVEGGIRFKIQADVRTDLIAELKKNYKVEMLMPTETPQAQPGAQPPTTQPSPTAPVGSAAHPESNR